MSLYSRLCAVVLAASLATMLVLSAAQAQSAQNAPDFAAICPKAAALEDGKAIETIVVPFGNLDIDNDGKTEAVTEVVQGSLGVHAIAVAHGGAEARSTTCDGCVSAFTNRVRVVAIDDRNYVIEYSSGYLARLWEMLPDGSGHARCWFQPEHVPHIEAAIDPPLCEAALNGTVRRIPITTLPYKRQEPMAEVSELGIYPSNSSRASEMIRIDLDNDGTEENLLQLLMYSVGCQSRQSITILDGAGLLEVSGRNRALSKAQDFSCHTRNYGVIEFGGRFYIEGTAGIEHSAPDGAPAPPFWTIMELAQSATRQLCRFGFQSKTTSFVAR